MHFSLSYLFLVNMLMQKIWQLVYEKIFFCIKFSSVLKMCKYLFFIKSYLLYASLEIWWHLHLLSFETKNGELSILTKSWHLMTRCSALSPADVSIYFLMVLFSNIFAWCLYIFSLLKLRIKRILSVLDICLNLHDFSLNIWSTTPPPLLISNNGYHLELFNLQFHLILFNLYILYLCIYTLSSLICI